MSKKKLIEEIKLNPARYYRVPSDVGRDRRFSNDERLEILAAWEKEVAIATSEGGEPGGEVSLFNQVKEARRVLEIKLQSAQAAAREALREQTKFPPIE